MVGHFSVSSGAIVCELDVAQPCDEKRYLGPVRRCHFGREGAALVPPATIVRASAVRRLKLDHCPPDNFSHPEQANRLVDLIEPDGLNRVADLALSGKRHDLA
jgi:hypothetical protein